MFTATVWGASVQALVVTRGPLLQNPDNDPTTVTIVWWTDSPGDSKVEYGTTTALGQSITVPTAGSCEVGSAGTCHSVRLTGLTPGTRYYYQLSSNGVVLQPASLDTYFTTLRAPNDPGEIFFTVIGDWGSGATAYYDVANNQNAADPPLLFTVGDNAYQNGTQSDWDSNALPAYSVLFRRAMFFPVLGNHDLNSVGASNWASSVQIRMLQMPRNAPPGQEERYWALESGNVLFLGLDANSPALNSTQRAWIQNQLATTSRKWKIVFLHQTPYSCANGLASIGSNLTVRSQWGPLFETYGVDIVFTGHDHIYERSRYWDEYLPDGSAGQDGKGTVYIMTGGGGATLDSAANVDANGPYRQPLFGSKTYCPWLAQDCPGGPSNYCSFARYQHTAVRITNDSTLTVEAVDRNNVVFDTFIIVKANPTATPTVTPTVTATAPPSPTPTALPSFTATFTASPTFSGTPTATATLVPTATVTVTSTPSASVTPTISALPTYSPPPTWTSTSTATRSMTPAGSPTHTASATPVPSLTSTPLPTATRSITSTPTSSATPTPSASATFSRTPTATRTVTSTPNETATPLPSASATPTTTPPPALCTGTAPGNPCAPGRGAAAKDCHLEFAVPEPAPRDRAGVPLNRVNCVDGEPTCDRDGDATNGTCSIPVHFCLNNRDPRLPTCIMASATLVDLRKPDSRSADPADQANLATLRAVFGSGGFGLTVYERGVLSQVGAPLLAHNWCSGEVLLSVPVRRTTRGTFPGTRRVRLLLAAGNGAVDPDTLVLQCRPSP